MTPRHLILGLQHTVAMFGATVLVPLLTGLNPSVALFTAGVGTLVFHLVTGRMVPVFLGSSFAFIAPILAAKEAGFSLSAIGGGIAAAGLVYVLFALLVLLSRLGEDAELKALLALGVRRERLLLPFLLLGTAIALAAFLLGEGVRWPYRLAFATLAFVGPLGGLEAFLAVSDTLNGLMALPNLLGLVLLGGVVGRLVYGFFRGEPWVPPR